MNGQTLVHSPVGGKLMTGPFKVLLAVAGIGAIVALYRFFLGIGAVSSLNDGYPWGIWIAFDVVVGTALGCGGYAVALLVYILNRGKYHPLVRPAVLTSLLGYGLAVLAVTIDLGRFWSLWKVTIFFWRWTHSPQLEVALCVAAYNLVLLVELSPALFEKWRSSPSTRLRAWSERGLRFVDRGLVWILALGILLPTMHQSSLGTMMLLPGPRMHPLWFTPWLPFLFLVNCIVIGYAVVVLEASFSAAVFGRRRETAMLTSLSRVAAWVALCWVAFRLVEVAVAGKLPLVASATGIAFLAEVFLTAAGAAILLSQERLRTAHVAGARRDSPVPGRRALPGQHVHGRIQPGAAVVLLPRIARAPDHIRNSRVRGRAVHRGRQNLANPGRRRSRGGPAREVIP